MKFEILLITEADIRRWVGSASFQKGSLYFQQSKIIYPQIKGQTLLARCHGSQAAWYQVQATLGPENILTAHCSCPQGAGGRCKHIAALLLTWLNAPAHFQESEYLEVALEKRSKAELIVLIRLMLEREPDLEVLLDLPLPGTASSHKPIDGEMIRRQVEHAFDNPYEDWGWADPNYVVRDLKPLFELAEENFKKEYFENTATIYQEIANTFLEYSDAVLQDQEGHLGGVLRDCIEVLGKCLQSLPGFEQREGILGTLFEIYAWDTLKAGGIGISEEAPEIMIEQATPEERQRIIEWLQSILPTGDSWSDDYRRQSLGGFLIALQEDQLDDEAFLALSRQTGRIHDLVERLLSLNRVDEAARETHQASDYQLLGLADIFVEHGQGSLAQSLIRDRARTSSDTRLLSWLMGYTEQQGDFTEALDVSIKLFWMRPSVKAYTDMRRLAEPIGQWPELRTQTLNHLAEKGDYPFLTKVYLAEEQIDLALATLEKARAGSRWGVHHSFLLQVAEAASQTRPRESIHLYQEIVRYLISIRGRGNYAQAAGYLKHVQELYRRIGDLPGWQRLIKNLREENRNLRALQDELNRARL